MRDDGDPTDRQSHDPRSGVRRMLPRVPVVVLRRMSAPDTPHAQREADAQLVHDHVYGVVAVVLGQASPFVDDAAQEALEAVYRNAASVVAPEARPGDATAWVNAIAARKAIDVLRGLQSAKRRYTSEPLDGDGVADRVSAPPDEAIATLQFAEHLLGVLDAPRQAVILLRYWGGQTDGEIAAAMAVPLGTVKTWLRTALQLLGEQVERIQSDQSGEIRISRARNTSRDAEGDPCAQLRALLENVGRTGR